MLESKKVIGFILFAALLLVAPISLTAMGVL
jgi:hypothetical protein